MKDVEVIKARNTLSPRARTNFEKRLRENLREAEFAAKFYKEKVVLITNDGTRYYHFYGCPSFGSETKYQVTNESAAKAKGYSVLLLDGQLDVVHLFPGDTVVLALGRNGAAAHGPGGGHETQRHHESEKHCHRPFQGMRVFHMRTLSFSGLYR